MRHPFRVLVTALLPGALLASVLAATPAGASPPVVLSLGHTDAPGIAIEDGGFFVHVHDEETDTEYLPEEVILHALPNSETTVPNISAFSFLGAAGDPIWVLPQVEDPDLLFLGFATEEIEPGVLVGDELTWALESVSGPGSFHLYTTGIFGDPTVIFDSDDSLPQSTTLGAGTHTHGNWAFTAPGEYTVSYRMTGELVDDGPIDSGLVDFTFIVSEPSECDAGAPSVSVGDVSVAEDNTGTNRAVKFAVTLSEPAPSDLTVNWEVVPGTATSPGDIALTGAPVKTLKFKAGTTSRYVVTKAVPDAVSEPDEDYTVVLSNPSGGYVLGRDTGVATLRNDDVVAGNRLSVGDASACEGNSGNATKIAIPITLSEPAAGLVTVQYKLNENTATAGTDFNHFNGNTRTLKFNVGNTRKFVVVTVYRDLVGELDETLSLDVLSVSGPVTLSDGTGVGTIANDDDFSGE